MDAGPGNPLMARCHSSRIGLADGNGLPLSALPPADIHWGEARSPVLWRQST